MTSTMSIEAASPTDEAEMVVPLMPTIRMKPKSTCWLAVMRTSLRCGSPAGRTELASHPLQLVGSSGGQLHVKMVTVGIRLVEFKEFLPCFFKVVAIKSLRNCEAAAIEAASMPRFRRAYSISRMPPSIIKPTIATNPTIENAIRMMACPRSECFANFFEYVFHFSTKVTRQVHPRVWA